MLRKVSGLVLSGLLLATMIGCAGGMSMQRTEAGYTPTHVEVGEIIAYTAGQSTIKYDDLVRMMRQDLEKGMFDQKVHYIPLSESGNTAVIPQMIVTLNAELSIAAGMRGDYDPQITWTLRRKSDNLVFKDGTARASEWSETQTAAPDLQAAMQYVAYATVKKVKAAMEGAK